MMMRIKLKSVTELTASIVSRFGKLFTAKSGLGSEYVNRQFFQHYGFTSIPPENAQGIAFKHGNNIICISSEAKDDDKPILLDPKDSAIYSGKTFFVKLLVNGEMELKGNGTANSIRIGTGTLDNLIRDTVIAIYNGHGHIETGTPGGTTSQPVVGLAVTPPPPGNVAKFDTSDATTELAGS